MFINFSISITDVFINKNLKKYVKNVFLKNCLMRIERL